MTIDYTIYSIVNCILGGFITQLPLVPQEFVDENYLCFMQCTHIFFTQASAGGECESPIRELKQGPQALAAELRLTLSRWPPAPPGLERPEHALEEGRAHRFSTQRVMELWLGLHY